MVLRMSMVCWSGTEAVSFQRSVLPGLFIRGVDAFDGKTDNDLGSRVAPSERPSGSTSK